MTDTKLSANGFEITTCSRCGGSGHYSYNQITGSRCFGCDGTGRQFTARGSAAFRFYEELCTIAIDAVQPGDRIQCSSDRFTVADVLPTEIGTYWIKNDGTKSPIIQHRFTSVDGKSYCYCGFATVRLLPQGERKQKLLAQAIAYQHTLTTKGTPRRKDAA